MIVYETKKKKVQTNTNVLDVKNGRILEKRVRNEISKILKKYDIFFFAPVNFGMGKEGIPDVIACVNGRFLGIEAKGWNTGHILTEAQKKTIEEIKLSKGLTYVANPFNLVELEEVVRGVLYENKSY